MTVRNRPTVQDYVDRIQAKIAFNRQRASKLMSWGQIIHWVVIPIVIVLGASAMMTVALTGLYGDPLFGRPATRFLIWLTANYPGVWSFLTWLGPPRNGSSSASPMKLLLWGASWLLCLGGLKWLESKAKETGKKLRDQADKDGSALEFQEPGWRQLEALTTNMQAIHANVANAGGSVNISNTFQQMQTILQRGEGEKPWWTKPAGVVALAVVARVIAHFIGA